jgi:erythronate-4-phosphate dehydrogenase
MIRVIADHKIPFLKGELEKYVQVEYIPGKAISNHHLRNAQALLVRTRTCCNQQLLQDSAVKFIATATIGHDHIDTQYCSENGIFWMNVPGCNANSVKQYVSSSIAYIIEKEKTRLSDLTLGIIGLGNIGSRVKKLAETLGMNCLVNDPPRQMLEGNHDYVSLGEILQRSDIVSLHLPLYTRSDNITYHLANHDFFSSMKKGAWFINTSRGEIHDTEALLESINSGRLGGSVIDVWENEPQIDIKLLQMADLATPHIAGYSQDGKANGTISCVRALSRFFNLGLDNWQPQQIPSPQNPGITLNCKGKSKEEIFHELCFRTYNISEDSNRLKNSPNTFEQQREGYPVRREEKAYKVITADCNDSIRKIIIDLGFRIG